MVTTAILGYPRIGARRELKRLQEAYWSGAIDDPTFEEQAAALRLNHHRRLSTAGLDVLPSNDASTYDQMLDATCMLGAIPPRFAWSGGRVDQVLVCRMARGQAPGEQGRAGVAAMEMTKWFDTNYHYLVPELGEDLPFEYSDDAVVSRYRSARAAGIQTRPVLIGPLTWLRLGKPVAGLDPLTLLPRILPIYRQVLADLESAGALAVQMDEPILATDLEPEWQHAFADAYGRLAEGPAPAITLASYFGPLSTNAETALALPVAEVHIDALRGGDELERLLPKWPQGLGLSVGIVDGRNVWATDLSKALERLHPVREAVGPERLCLSCSCSLQHVPMDLDLESGLDPELRSWMAFADQKVAELVVLAAALRGEDRRAALVANAAAIAGRRTSPRVHHTAVQLRLAAGSAADEVRTMPHARRALAQRQVLNLPPLPTTTIGSFPQTNEIRQARGRYRRGEIDAESYRGFLESEIRNCIVCQESLGLDVLVHGEAERTDMVEFFGEHLSGFATTQHGWVSSYGSRCVKPPLIYGDIQRERQMTVDWARFAQGCSLKPVKGMLTGPVTILQWSFVRDDQPRTDTCRQLAYAIRDEVADLEGAGIGIIQIDEPAFREGLPLRPIQQRDYLDQAVRCFRIATGGVKDSTQIHTHMCYSEFNDVIEWIAAMDADVLSIETSRSHMELLEAFRAFDYPNEIGPGVFDIHSPRIPSVEEMEDLIQRAAEFLPVSQLWVNPDCGLKTRAWPEVQAALTNMVAAAERCRRLTAGAT